MALGGSFMLPWYKFLHTDVNEIIIVYWPSLHIPLCLCILFASPTFFSLSFPVSQVSDVRASLTLSDLLVYFCLRNMNDV